MTEPHWTSIADTLNGVGQTLLIIFGFVFTYKQLRVWRVELLGSKRIDAAIALGKATVKIEAAFQSARNPFTYQLDEEITNKLREKSKSENDFHHLKQEFEFNRRLGFVLDALKALDEAYLDCQILIGDQVEEYIKDLNKKHKELHAALYRVHHAQGDEAQLEKAYAIVYSGVDPEDEFGKEVSKLTQKLRVIVRNYVH
jgi:hypothetical protein